ncbi:23S rRNA pseudouridine1911/1915/1917 synthase [Paenibacillus turicensis]|uniref:Pseudouridine synthase n=1 Tax=Paenibacillus turicensis TaxID=160487 RepID=A0ABS4FPC6_9BACL|nr:RluA family pseudouridine synthase [Paenibacillus turicensis]MBP1904396.1 23S rRNA pseudouridine1911/1915/1917 synthase [Paenibacillus turicensis]
MNDNKNNAQVEAEADMMEWTIEAASVKQRIDKFVTENIGNDVSRTQVQLWIQNGDITVNGESVKGNYKLALGDVIALIMPEPEFVEIVAENIPLDVYYEDQDVIVVNKQRGMVVHPAPGHSSGTLVNALMYHCKDLSGINGELRPGIVHRIDKDTSGLIMAAKNDKSHASLAAQLKEHSVTRKYIALVHGNLSHDQGTVDAPIGRDAQDRKMYTVTERNSKHAVTHFQVMERFGDYTLVELKLETGRTHQIRVHMKFIGHPLVGDPMYGRSKGIKMEGQALHAAVLGFIHPTTSEYMEFSAPLPQDMEDVLFSLRNR